MSAFDTTDPLNTLFRAVPLGSVAIDLNRSDDEVVYQHDGCSVGYVQVAAKGSGASGTWVLTVERSNDGDTWEALASPTTYSAFGFQAELALNHRFTRVRVSTPQGAASDAVVTMFARA